MKTTSSPLVHEIRVLEKAIDRIEIEYRDKMEEAQAPLRLRRIELIKSCAHEWHDRGGFTDFCDKCDARFYPGDEPHDYPDDDY